MNSKLITPAFFNQSCVQDLLPNVFLAMPKNSIEEYGHPIHYLLKRIKRGGEYILSYLTRLSLQTQEAPKAWLPSDIITTSKTASAAKIIHTVLTLCLNITFCSHV